MEDRKIRCELLELCQRSIPVYRKVRSRSRGPPQVRAQDARTLVRRNFFEFDLLTTAAAQKRFATRCADVVDPLHVVSEH